MPLEVNIFGHYNFSDLPGIGLAEVNQEEILETLRAFLEEENRFVRELTAMLADEGTGAIETFGGGGVGGELQVFGEISTIEATKEGAGWNVGYPIVAAGDRRMVTQAWLDEATLAHLNTQAVNAAVKDANFVLKTILRAILRNVNVSFDDRQWPGTGNEGPGVITVRRLANADGAAGTIYSNSQEILLSTLQHYITSGSASLTEGAFTLARDKLRDVGADGNVIYIVSRATADSAEGLTNFVKVRDPNIVDPAAKYALVESPRARGRIANGEVIEWPHMPNGYIIALDTTKAKPVRIRNHRLQKYQGFQLALDEERGEVLGRPLINRFWRRLIGAGIRNRVGAVVVQVTTNGAYTAPTI